MKALYSFLTLLLLATVFVSCKEKKIEESAMGDEVIPVRTIKIEKETSRQNIYASGQFTTDDETNLSFKNGGVINRIFVREGDAVTQGQLIATLNPTEINGLAQQAELGYQKAQRDYERADNLYKDSVATLEQMQNAKTALDVAKEQLGTARFNQNYTEIRATTSGYVLHKFVNEGQIVGAGTPIVQINGAKQGNWILKVGVSDNQWAAIKTGDKAEITTDAFPGQPLHAFVSKKSEGIDPYSGTFTIQLQLKDKPGGLASGLFGKATIIPSANVSVWKIPFESLLDGDKNEGYVFVTNDHKKAEKVKVSIGSIDRDNVLITGGLEGKNYLIVSGSAYLNDKSDIRQEN